MLNQRYRQLSQAILVNFCSFFVCSFVSRKKRYVVKLGCEASFGLNIYFRNRKINWQNYNTFAHAKGGNVLSKISQMCPYVHRERFARLTAQALSEGQIWARRRETFQSISHSSRPFRTLQKKHNSPCTLLSPDVLCKYGILLWLLW